MQYKTLPFAPNVPKRDPSASAALALESMINDEAVSGWEFVGLQNHSVIVPGGNGCFGFGATAPYPKTLSLAVFRK